MGRPLGEVVELALGGLHPVRQLLLLLLQLPGRGGHKKRRRVIHSSRCNHRLLPEKSNPKKSPNKGVSFTGRTRIALPKHVQSLLRALVLEWSFEKGF